MNPKALPVARDAPTTSINRAGGKSSCNQDNVLFSPATLMSNGCTSLLPLARQRRLCPGAPTRRATRQTGAGLQPSYEFLDGGGGNSKWKY